ncbi:MAG: carbamoyltransferase HypF [Gemmatimonadaceae bacterium]|nr:carbamoyltransferase HypF [Gemmatimonadaceae bacterium]
MTVAARFTVRGVVQGVGFRPFVATLAARLGLTGWVRNESGIVRVHVEGAAEALEAFAHALEHEAPPLAAIAALDRREIAPEHGATFEIAASVVDGARRPAVPPDVVMCEACAAELADPANRRHRYPFTTCTDCGPRYSVIRAMPYDRERTTLAEFPLCDACRREYAAPGDRRFHAESIACPACGPHVWLESRGTRLAERDDAIAAAGRRLADGQVLAIRGLGGFHLACDATNGDAVAALRARKQRDVKPLAVMVSSLADAEALADLTPTERRLLASRERPIVLVHARASSIAPGVAPGLARIGLMLAYTPLHRLLLEAAARPLVMTSGNLSDEPIAADLDEGRERLAPLADAVLLHDRDIAARIDDSVVRASAGPADGSATPPIVLRRARGFAPLALALPVATRVPVLAVGAHLKHTLAWADGREAWVSPHIGDLDTWETLAHAERTRDTLGRLLGLTPGCIATDLHGGYLSHRLGDPWPDVPRVVVQHHHAHVAAVMAEHGAAGPVLGIAYDGTGAGDDGTSWGAEFLLCDLANYRRVAHWLPVPLPGGDKASREGWRVAVGYAQAMGVEAAFDDIAPATVAQARRQLAARVNAPIATSMGRLFDAVAALAGVRSAAAYEGQAAMELEALAERAAPWAGEPLWEWLEADAGPLVVSPLGLLHAVHDWRRQAPAAAPARAAGALHDMVVAATVSTAARLCGRHGLETVVLGGGTWQNALLMGRTAAGLRRAGMRVLTPRALPPNDGAIAYGQAVVAIARETSGNA